MKVGMFKSRSQLESFGNGTRKGEPMNSVSDHRDGRTFKSPDESGPDLKVEARNFQVAETYLARLKEALSDTTVAEFARRSGVADSALRSYLDGRSTPGFENAARIARASGRSLDWFASSERDISYANVVQDAAESLSFTTALGRRLREEDSRLLTSFAMIPLYDVRASAGHGAWNDEERISKMLAFRRDWLRAELAARIADLILVYVDGDSMEPTLSDGDVVMVDRGQVEVRDGIYVWAADGALLIKRLQRLAAGRVQVLSDNARFPAYEADLQAAVGANIIGRVVWAGVKL